ncbi:hypothetical protein J6590_050648 [Homalodisca vitripennis]|nr:hypothetical protein J6590_050648 [Homalodisca vitripennis]
MDNTRDRVDYIPSCTPSTPRRVAPTLLVAEDVHLCNLTEMYSCIGPHDSVNGQYTRPRRLHTFLHSKYTTSCCSHTPHGRGPSMDNTRDRVDYIPSCTPSTPRRVAPTLLVAEDVHLCNLTEMYSCIGPHDSVNGQYTRLRRLHAFLHSKYTTSCCSHTPGRGPSMDNTRDCVDYMPSCTPSTPRRVAPTLVAEDVHLCNLTEIYSCIGPHDSVNGQYTRPRRLHNFLHSKYTTSCCSHTPHGRGRVFV